MLKAFPVLLIVLSLFTNCLGQSREEINQLIKEIEGTKADTARALLLARLSIWYLNFSPDTSTYYSTQALKLSRDIGFKKGESQALVALGDSYKLKGEIVEAMKLSLNGLRIAEENNLDIEKLYALTRIGAIYNANLADYSSGLYYLKRAEKIDIPTNESSNYFVPMLYLNFGEGYEWAQKYDSADLYLNKALATADPSKNYYPIISLFLGNLQLHYGNTKEALMYYRQSILNSTPESRAHGEIMFAFASFFRTTGQMDSSIYYAKKALDIDQRIGHKPEALKASNLLAEVYEPIDASESHKYLLIANNLQRELYGAERIQEFNRILLQNQQQQFQLETENINYRNRIRQYILVGGLSIVLLVAFFTYRNNRQKQKVNVALNKQKQEIEETLQKLKATQSQLIHSEKMASLGELTAGIAHEIQNPLNFVNNFSEVNKELVDELLREEAVGSSQSTVDIVNDIKSNSEKIYHHGKRADGIVKSMLQHSQKSSGQKELTDINALCDEYLRLAYHGMRAKDKSFNAEFRTELDPDLPQIHIVPQDIGRVILNLINNAFYVVDKKAKSGAEGYMPLVTVSTKKLNGTIEISVEDNGDGIHDNIKDKIFQPFFTTKPTGQGTGLGLSLSYDIVKALGGELKVESRDGEGAEFIIKLYPNQIGS